MNQQLKLVRDSLDSLLIFAPAAFRRSSSISAGFAEVLILNGLFKMMIYNKSIEISISTGPLISRRVGAAMAATERTYLQWQHSNY